VYRSSIRQWYLRELILSQLLKYLEKRKEKKKGKKKKKQIVLDIPIIFFQKQTFIPNIKK